MVGLVRPMEDTVVPVPVPVPVPALVAAAMGVATMLALGVATEVALVVPFMEVEEVMGPEEVGGIILMEGRS